MGSIETSTLSVFSRLQFWKLLWKQQLESRSYPRTCTRRFWCGIPSFWSSYKKTHPWCVRFATEQCPCYCSPAQTSFSTWARRAPREQGKDGEISHDRSAKRLSRCTRLKHHFPDPSCIFLPEKWGIQSPPSGFLVDNPLLGMIFPKMLFPSGYVSFLWIHSTTFSDTPTIFTYICCIPSVMLIAHYTFIILHQKKGCNIPLRFLVGGNWLPSISHFPRNIGLLSSSSQLTNSHLFQRVFVALAHPPDG